MLLHSSKIKTTLKSIRSHTSPFTWFSAFPSHRSLLFLVTSKCKYIFPILSYTEDNTLYTLLGTLLFLFLFFCRDYYFFSSFSFTAKLRARFRDFPYVSWLHTCIASFTYQHPPPVDTFVKKYQL